MESTMAKGITKKQKPTKALRLLPFAFFILPFAFSFGCGKPIDEIPLADRAAVSDLAELSPSAGELPWWRGANLDGKAERPAPPPVWTETENVLWKSPIPGAGHSSPIVRGDAVYVTTADESSQTQSLLCYDRQTGEERWTQVTRLAPRYFRRQSILRWRTTRAPRGNSARQRT